MKTRRLITFAVLFGFSAYAAIGKERNSNRPRTTTETNISRTMANTIEHAMETPFRIIIDETPDKPSSRFGLNGLRCQLIICRVGSTCTTLSFIAIELWEPQLFHANRLTINFAYPDCAHTLPSLATR